jgi:hypothetical protein
MCIMARRGAKPAIVMLTAEHKLHNLVSVQRIGVAK